MTDSHSNPWYALKVRTRSEPVAATALRNRGYDPFCPIYTQRRRYCDRTKIVENAVFPGYPFCRFNLQKKVSVLSTQAIEYIVAPGGVPAPVPDQQIDGIRRSLEAGAQPTPYFRAGQRVRVELGALAGVEGVLTRDSDMGRLIVSVDLLQRSVALHIDEEHVRPILIRLR